MKNLSCILSLSLLLGVSLAQGASFEEAWKAFRQDMVSDDLLQEECTPRVLAADPAVEYKGTIVAIHGFTACPQQYLEIAQNWQKLGYQVVLPLLPGHGLKWQGEFDQYDSLPDNNDAILRYGSIARGINRLMESAEGERHIVGLSVGGTVSLLATQYAPTLYHRSLAISPFLKVSKQTNPETEGFFQRLARKVVGPRLLNSIGAGKSVIGWGEGCEQDERANGRAGICNFRLTHVAAVEKLGQLVMNQATHIQTPTQLVGVEKDMAINNKTNKKFYKKLNKSKQQNSVCFYPAPANHSLLSRFDSPTEDKFWLNAALEDFTNFIAQGQFIPQDGKSHKEKVPLCRI